jgi:hypothetical protein
MILLNLINNILNKKEKFTNEEKKDNDFGKDFYLYIAGYNPDLNYNDLSPIDIFLIVVIYLIILIISICAASLSFSCTWNGTVTNIFVRLVFALCAFLLGPIYLLWYFIVNWLFRGCING